MILPNYFMVSAKEGRGSLPLDLCRRSARNALPECDQTGSKRGEGGRGAVGDFRNPSSHIVELPLFHHPLLCIGGGGGVLDPYDGEQNYRNST